MIERASNLIDCAKVRGFLDAFLDHQVSVETLLRVTDHMKRCRECLQLVQEGMRLKRALRRVVNSTPLPYGLSMRIRTGWMEGR